MAVQLLNVNRQYELLKSQMDEAILNVLSHGKFILGPEVSQLEKEIASLCTVDYGIGVASGTDALLLAYRAAGIQPGDEVITTDFSFFATAGVVSRLGAIPVFVDIEPDSYNIDPNMIEKAITKKTKAIVPVHLFGQVADMDPIMEIAQKHKLAVIEDAAQAIGAEYKSRKAGSIGDYGCFSFYPSKNLGATGDGGMIVTNNKDNNELCRMLRVHGSKPKYYHKIVGYNSRLASIQAAGLLVKLKHLQSWSEKRIENARRYTEAFQNIPNIKTPITMDYSTFHIFNQYTIAVPDRDGVIAKLREKEIGCDIYYPVPFHQQECFASLGHKDADFPVTNKAAAEVFSIPIYSELTLEEQDEVISVIKEIVS